jgi:putative flippase GtrA
MSIARISADTVLRSQAARYVLNGLLASAVHFAVLLLALDLLHLRSAGLSNLLASVVGISASFLGNRYFVFAASAQPFADQLLRFGGLYGAIAAVHAVTLWAWTDVGGLDYRVGFLLAVGIQLILSFVGNKTLVFNR